MEKTDVHTWASRLIVIVCVLALAFVIGKYGVPVLMPFLLAGIVVMFVRPAGKRLSAVIAVRQEVCCVFVLLLLVGALGTAVYFGGYFLWREASSFYAWLYENADSLLEALGGLFATKEQGGALPAFLQKLLELPVLQQVLPVLQLQQVPEPVQKSELHQFLLLQHHVLISQYYYQF